MSGGAMRLWEPEGLNGEIGAPRTDLNEQMQYRSNCIRDLDNVERPKEETLERWETPDFHEFNRIFKLPRAEFIYLIKGIAYEKNFNLNLNGDNMTKNYRLLNFRCGDSLIKKRKLRNSLTDQCCFHL
jgi:hypothetical protein